MLARNRVVNGKRLQDELDKKGWLPQNLADKIGCDIRVVIKMLNSLPVLRSEVDNAENALNRPIGYLTMPMDRSGTNSHPAAQIKIYWAAPYRNFARNHVVQKALEDVGFSVLLPHAIVQKHTSKGRVPQPPRIRELCRDAIIQSNAVVVDLNEYGLDSAWEIGYAQAVGIRVIGLSQDAGGTLDPRRVNRKPYLQNFMHGWEEHKLVGSVNDLDGILPKNERVYVCGSFSNERAMDLIRKSNLGMKRPVILPKDEIGNQPNRFTARKIATDLLEKSKTAVIMLPRYGMDTSWQIGYAEGIGLRVLGLLLPEEAGQAEEQYSYIWDHWMHNWEEKLTALSLNELVAILDGLNRWKLLNKRPRFDQKTAS